MQSFRKDTNTPLPTVGSTPTWILKDGTQKDATLKDGPLTSKLNDGSKTTPGVEPKKGILERMRSKVIFEKKFFV